MLRIGVVVLACLIARPALAQFAPITSRDYSIDFYNGDAIGDTSMIGMGGAGAASVLGTAGVLLNPSAIAVRPTTDHDSWTLDSHFDYLTGRFSSDYDNNGQVASGGLQLLTIGFGGRYHDWALAATFTIQGAPVVGSSLHGSAETSRGTLAKWFPEYDVAIGVGIQVANFSLQRSDNTEIFAIQGTGLIAGATWLPQGESFRLGAAIDTAIDGGQVTAQNCDPENCDGYILPDRVRAPWRVVAGAALRNGPTPWNQPVITPFRDEKAVTAAADIVVTGATSNGYGLEAFGMQQLQPSGRHTVISVRGGVEYEWLPGRLRVRTGSYWEPGRFDGIAGRLHATFGADLRVLQFHLWGVRRGRISITGDIADRYRNLGISIGFWH